MIGLGEDSENINLIRHCEERSNLYAIQRNLTWLTAYVEITSFLAIVRVY